jgi:hypothetical protein
MAGLVGGCGTWEPTKDVSRGTVIRGEVRDSLSNRALAGVSIAQGTVLTGRTDSSGTYLAGFLHEEEHSVTYRLSGYHSKSFRCPEEMEMVSAYSYRKNVQLVPSIDNEIGR